MRKLDEIGDQPLPITKIEKKGKDVFYYFDIPLTGSKSYRVSFEYEAWTPLILSYSEVLQGDDSLFSLLDLVEEIGELQDSYYDTPDEYREDAVKLRGYEVDFKEMSKTKGYEMQNFEDHTLPIKIMATVQYCFMDFIKKQKDLDYISFRANMGDKGRIRLYERFAKMIGKAFNFTVLRKWSTTDFEYTCVNTKRVETILSNLLKIKEITDSGKDIDMFIKEVLESP